MNLKTHNFCRTGLFIITGLLLTSLISVTQAGVEVRNFDNPKQERRYHQLVDELRCLVCQNQNLADSNSQLALDLRDKIYEMVKTNQTDQQVIDYMVNRYGEFVLYNPPLDPVTASLWLGPIILLIAGIIMLLFNIKNREKSKPVELSDADHERSKKLLNDEDEKE